MRRRLAQAAVVFTVFCTTFASNSPSVLYVVYQQRYDFSSLVVTAIFGTYALSVLATLLLIGRVSDHVGRRPVLLIGAALLVASSVLFALASSVVWLFAARALQGAATGTVIAAAGAALVELSPRGNRRRAALLNTVSFLTGAATGSIAFGLMVQYLPRPTVFPFLIEIVLDSVALVGVALLVSETLPELEVRRRWRIQRPSVPREIRGPFVLAALTMGIGWSLGGMYGSLSPTMARQILHVSSHVVAGLILCIFNLVGGLTQLVSSRRSSRATMVCGLLLVCFGSIVIQLAFFERSTALFFVATLLAGAGGAMGFVGSLALVNELAPISRRAETLATYNVIGYFALSVPVVGVGVLANALGLRTASLVFAVVLVCASVTVALLVYRPSSLEADKLSETVPELSASI